MAMITDYSDLDIRTVGQGTVLPERARAHAWLGAEGKSGEIWT